MAGEMELVQTQPRFSADKINPLKLPKLQVDGAPTKSVAPMDFGSMPTATQSSEQATQEDAEVELAGGTPVRGNPSDPDWTPGTRYLRSKLYAGWGTASYKGKMLTQAVPSRRKTL
jgi:hypothetical protein